MIGHNGGLIGAARDTGTTQSVPGVWTLREQLKAKRASNWPVTIIPGIEDPYFYSNSLLLYGDGVDASTAIVDSSLNTHDITVNGNAQISTTESKFGGSSLYFDGNGDYLTVADSDDFDIGASDFTLEAWVYLTGYSANYNGYYLAQILAKDSGSTGRSLTFAINGTSSSWTSVDVSLFASTSPVVTVGNTGSFNFSLNTWYHVAAVRNGTSVRLYVNGNDVGGGTNSINAASTTTSLTIGAEDPFYQAQGYAYWFPGYIDDLRITKGVARYTSDFTPPTESFSSPSTGFDSYFFYDSLLLRGNGTNGSTAMLDSSSNNHAITVSGNAQISTNQSKFGGSSILFDGAGDYIAVPASSDFDFGTGDFTVEFWMYRTAVGNYATIISHNYGTNPNFLLQTSTSLGQRWRLFLNGTSVSITEGSDHSLNTWYHYAIVRNGGGSNNVVIYRDGSSVATGTFTNNVGNATAVYNIGGRGNNTLPFAGYIDDFRITKGIARYTANFTPPGAL